MSDLPHSPSANTIFCDDIRREDNGKLLLIGMYVGGMTVVGPAPHIPTLAMFLTYSEPRGCSEDAVRMEVLLSGKNEPLIAMTVLNAGPRPDVIGDDEENRLAIMAPVKLPPFLIEGPSTIRVRWYCGDKRVHGGSLKIDIAAPADADATPATAQKP